MGEIFGIGIEELIFIGILFALLFGPESIPRLARNAGKALNRLFRSPLYQEGQHIRKQIQDIPSALARLAELEELQQNLNTEIRDLKAAIDPNAAPPSAAPDQPVPPDTPAGSSSDAPSNDAD